VECADSGKDLQSMALFASATPNNRNFNSQSSFYVNNSQSRGRGRNNSHRGRGRRFNNNNQYSQYSSQSNPPTQGQLPFHNTIRTNQKVLGLNAKSVEKWDIKHWIAITGWILPIKADIHLPN
jgi:hypothetical protein